MKQVIALNIFLLILVLGAMAQQEPILTLHDAETYQRERSIIKFLGIRMSRHVLSETKQGEVTGRIALLMDIYYSERGNAEYAVYYDESGAVEQYTVFAYDDKNSKVEEIRFSSDSTLLNGILFVYNERGLIKSQLNYDENGNSVAEFTYKSQNDSVIVRTAIQADGSVINNRRYVYYPPLEKGKMAYINTRNMQGVLLDSTKYTYNTHGLVASKEVFINYGASEHKTIDYVYSPDDALIKYTETSGTKALITSIEYDDYGNIVAMITSTPNGEITRYVKIEHYSLTNKITKE